jgi:hypothetical protein
MDAIDAIIVRHQSSCKTSPSNEKRKAKAISFEATSGLANKRDKMSWGRCEYHNKTHRMTTIIVTGASIAAKQARRTQPWSQVTLSMGNTRQIGQIHAPDLIRRKRWDQQKKQKQAAKTSAVAMTHGTRVTGATLSA